MPHLFLRWLRRRRRVHRGGTEDPGIVRPAAAMVLQLLRIAAQGIGLAEIPDNATIPGVIDNGKRLLCRLAEPVERGPQIVAGQQECDRSGDEIPHSLSASAFSGWVDDTAQATVAVDDEPVPDAARREAPPQLIE